jgi:hypothetical protein
MRVFKTRAFSRWAGAEGLGDDALAAAVLEMEAGLIDAELGAQVAKKRVALPGRGRRGSTRTLVAFRRADKAFYIYGFNKTERANISGPELKALKLLAKELLGYPQRLLTKAIQAGELIEIRVDDNG